MTLFMLQHHDATTDEIRELAPSEMDAISGGDGGHTGIGDPGCGSDETACITSTHTPNGDGGDLSTDCDD